MTNLRVSHRVTLSISQKYGYGMTYYLSSLIKYCNSGSFLIRSISVSIIWTIANPINMMLWNGAIDTNGDLTWDGASTNDLEFEVDGAVFGGKNGTGIYHVLIKDSGSFGWCNIDRLSSWPGTKVKLKLTPPAGFDQSNSSVYLAVEGEDNMLAQFDMFDSSTNTFEEHTGLVPVGLDCHIIFVGEQSGNYVYYILSTAVSSTGTYIVPSSGLISTTSCSQVESAILALP